MAMTSETFTELIRIRRLLEEVQKLKLVDDCPYCKDKVQLKLDSIQQRIEHGCHMGIVI